MTPDIEAQQRKKFIIIDGNSVIHRAFHALPPLATKEGTVVNAVYGFFTILFKVIKDLEPAYLAVAFDVKGPTFRHILFPAYKGTRQKQPPEVYEQISMVRAAVKQLGFASYELAGVEADDIIGTLTKLVPHTIDSYIVTGDKDSLQLVNKHTFVYTMRKGVSDTITYDQEMIKEKFDGLTVEQMIDYKALRGDPSDNIPGVKGVGEKTATTLLQKYTTLENLYKHIDEISGSVQKKLQDNKETAYLSKTLATIKCDVDIPFTLEEAQFTGINHEAAVQLLQQYEFNSLLNTITNFTQQEDVPVVAHNDGYKLVNTASAVKKLVNQLQKCSILAFDTETSALDPLDCDLVGFSIAWKTNEAYFIPAQYVEHFRVIFENSKIHKVGHNIKFDAKVLQATSNIIVQGIVYDTMLASYVLNPGSRGHGLDALVLNEFGYEMMSYETLVGKGKTAIPLPEVAIQKLTFYAAEDADYTWRLYEQLQPKVKAATLESILEMEVKLIPILAEMELNGIIINVDFLAKLSKQLAKSISKVEKIIYSLAGREFNIASPKQLKEILFDELNIDTSGISKTKTGISTAASELEKLKSRHPIIASISEYRELAKLKSTYVDALPKLVNKRTQRLHTNYNQTIAATGRLSSTDPNLQNIPIRTALGREIRKAFVAPEGKVLLSLDYSQVELRIVAHMANDESFIQAFKSGADIHTRTAAELHDLKEDEVTKNMRREAKSVNFGLLYGMGVRGLQRDTGMSYEEAQEYLEKYFSKHPAIKNYIDSTKEVARRQGYVESMFGRRRYLPDITSGMAQVRAAAERAAINMPIQGTASDIMKLAMLDVAKLLKQEKLPALMLLQVHDELVFEVPEAKAKAIAKQIKITMEQVAKLKVPLVVDVAMGNNWQDLEPLLW